MEILYVEDEQNKAHQVMQVIKDNILLLLHVVSAVPPYPVM